MIAILSSAAIGSYWDSNSVSLRFGRLFLAAWLLAWTGCGEQRESLHELEHVVPSHWPSDLSDAAHKILERVASLEASGGRENSTVWLELQDLVAWSPEIAADTDLSESEWLKIYQVVELLRGSLRNAAESSQLPIDQLRQLTELLENAHRQLPAEKPLGEPLGENPPQMSWAAQRACWLPS
jgi:hypothetical protein